MTNAIICDLDGCLFDTAWIFDDAEKLGFTGEQKWAYFHQNVNNEKSRTCEKLKNILLNVVSKDTVIVFMTARSEEIQYETETRLAQELPELTNNSLLLMRQYGNYLPSEVVKEMLLRKVLEDYHFNVVLAIDDDDMNLSMFAHNGIPTLKWAITSETEGEKDVCIHK
ncbi:MAG: hypothetical protein E7Z93_00585 [Cyanobacteria bacterium SIG32]|nr:hypothetical protein [Cyanobacteria bacterium SIG32]